MNFTFFAAPRSLFLFCMTFIDCVFVLLVPAICLIRLLAQCEHQFYDYLTLLWRFRCRYPFAVLPITTVIYSNAILMVEHKMNFVNN